MRPKSGRKFRYVKDGFILLLLMFLGTLITAKLDGLNEETFSGTFRAVDGDTLASDRMRYRLLGIDAPELRQTCGGSEGEWACGQAARAFLSDTLKRGTVKCVSNKKDKYARYLSRCTVDGEDVAGLVVAAGLAVTTEYFLYAEELDRAREQKIGLWSGAFAQPRDWRREHKAAEMDVPLAGLLTVIRHILGW